MSGALLEAKVLITGVDHVTPELEAIAKKIEAISRMGREVGKASSSLSGISSASELLTRAVEVDRAVSVVTEAFSGAAAKLMRVAGDVSRASVAIGEGAQSVRRQRRGERHGFFGRLGHDLKHTGSEVYPLLAGGAGFELGHLVKEGITAGAEYQHERVDGRNTGRTIEEIAAFEKAAQSTSTRVPTASYIESMKTLIETTSAFASADHAIAHLDFMMRTAAVLKAASGGKLDESAGEMGQHFAKFFEMRGVANDPARFEREGNEMTRAMAATGGTFNPREMRAFGSQAKAALRNYDIDYLSRIVPSIAGQITGEKAGTAAAAFNNVILGKARDQKQAAEWMKYGLLDPSKVDMKSGHVVSWSAGAVKGTDLAMSNPLRWFEEIALPAMKGKGVDIADGKELTKALAVMFRNQMSNQWANENAQLSDRQRLHKDADLIGKTESPEAMYNRNLSEDPTQALSALGASINSFASTLTVPVMKDAAGVLDETAHSLAGFTKSLAEWQRSNPELAKLAAGGAIGVGGVASGWLGFTAFTGLKSGFGLTGSAAALDGSAAALDAAAVKLAGGGALGNAVGGASAVAGQFKLSAGGAIGGLLRGVFMATIYELGTMAIRYGESKLPHPAYPPGYDPDAKANESVIQRVRDIAHELPGALSKLRDWIIPSAHAEGAHGSPYGALNADHALFAPLSSLGSNLAAALSGKIEANLKPDQIQAKLIGKLEPGIMTFKFEGLPAGMKLNGPTSAIVRANVGTSMPEAGPLGPNGTGRQ